MNVLWEAAEGFATLNRQIW